MELLRIGIVSLLALLLLPGCSRLGRVVGYADEEELKPPEVPAHLMARPETASGLARVSVDGGTASSAGTGGSVPGGPPVGGFTPDEDIVWTDPDNPDAPLSGLEETLAMAKSRGPWMDSYQDGRKLAMREGKPLLIWFTDTQRSPLCRSLSAELLSQPQFGDWAGERLVRIRLDFNVKSEDENDRLRKKDYLEMLKKRYKANGLPTMLVMAPDGTVTGRYRGYKRGEPEYYWGRVKNATVTAENHHKEWKIKMEKQGYRDWQDRKGRHLFAKLHRYRDGEMILVEPDGRKILAKERNLSDPDRLWIANQKVKRRG